MTYSKKVLFNVVTGGLKMNFNNLLKFKLKEDY